MNKIAKYRKRRIVVGATMFLAFSMILLVGLTGPQASSGQENLGRASTLPDISGLDDENYGGSIRPFRQLFKAALGQPTDDITARMLVEPNALVGPGPSHLKWSPQGATLAYVAPNDELEVLWLYEATTGSKHVLFDPAGHNGSIDVTSAQWSPQGDALLLSGEEALWLLGVETGNLAPLAEDGAKTAVAFSPTGEMVSYVQDNDLYMVRIADGEVQQLTSDGSEMISNGTHFNGTLDWVYSEEFATRVAQPAYAWSPDGKWLIYLSLDDEGVQQHPVTDFRTIPPTVSYTRYPTTGSSNPKASLHLIGFEDGKPTQPISLPEDAEYILPVFTWDPGSDELFYLAENREHTSLRLEAWNPETGTGRTVIEETDSDWVNEFLYVAPVFLDESGQFLWLSERDGFMHIYLYSREGELLRQLTEGEWLVDSLPWDLLTPGRPVHVDPSGAWAYFSSTQVSPLERHLTRLNIETGEMEQLSDEAGFHFAALSGDGQYLVSQFSSVETPPVILILKADGSLAHILGRYAGPSLDLPEVSREFLTVDGHDGVELHAQIVKPEGFNPEHKYPVIIHWYGGPTLQLVSDRYGTDNIFNHIERDVIYTQEGFIVWRLDNRGSFGRGHAFETAIAGQMGPAALADQLAGVEYLKSLPYVDAERIGVDGKSFGGFLTLYALIHEPDVFAAGVAGSGPTDWRTYDTVYTERYMGTPQQNPDGYEATELISRVDQLQVRPLIIHGLADTNVHLQNSVNLMDAMMQIDKPFDFLPLPNSDHHYGGDGLVGVLSEGARYFVQHLQPGGATPSAASPETATGLPNPASQYCAGQGGEVEIRDETGGEVGYCLFPDGSECEEWAFFNDECEPGSAQESTAATSTADTAGSEIVRYDRGYRFDQNGWTYLHIEGEPHERGFQHGYLLAPELAEIFSNFKELTYEETGKEWEFFVDQAVEQFAERIDAEYLDEIKGIADGAQAAGTEITWQEVLTWNGYEELLGYWWPNELAGKYAQPDDDHCSAFIATGSATKDGKIVMAHNSWDAFQHGQYLNVILDLEPAEGQRMFMQSAPGFIASFTDFFVTGAGIMGTETTIGGYSEYDPDEDPEFFRIRKAMQYADTLDDFVQLMEKKNNGGYANSWLLADADSGEIMRFELGLQYQNVERTKDGYFVGFNAPVDPRIRNLETSGSGYDDIRTPAGARRVRLTQLMEEHHGDIDVQIAEEILADHYDVYLEKENPGSRTVEGRYDLDAFEFWPARLPFAPQGAVDGKVMDSDMAQDLSFWARWGSSSGMPFDADAHINEHPQWDHLEGYLKDRPSQPWTFFKAGEGEPKA